MKIHMKRCCLNCKHCKKNYCDVTEKTTYRCNPNGRGIRQIPDVQVHHCFWFKVTKIGFKILQMF